MELPEIEEDFLYDQYCFCGIDLVFVLLNLLFIYCKMYRQKTPMNLQVKQLVLIIQIAYLFQFMATLAMTYMLLVIHYRSDDDKSSIDTLLLYLWFNL